MCKSAHNFKPSVSTVKEITNHRSSRSPSSKEDFLARLGVTGMNQTWGTRVQNLKVNSTINSEAKTEGLNIACQAESKILCQGSSGLNGYPLIRYPLPEREGPKAFSLLLFSNKLQGTQWESEVLRAKHIVHVGYWCGGGEVGEAPTLPSSLLDYLEKHVSECSSSVFAFSGKIR